MKGITFFCWGYSCESLILQGGEGNDISFLSKFIISHWLLLTLRLPIQIIDVTFSLSITERFALFSTLKSSISSLTKKALIWILSTFIWYIYLLFSLLSYLPCVPNNLFISPIECWALHCLHKLMRGRMPRCLIGRGS